MGNFDIYNSDNLYTLMQNYMMEQGDAYFKRSSEVENQFVESSKTEEVLEKQGLASDRVLAEMREIEDKSSIVTKTLGLSSGDMSINIDDMFEEDGSLKERIKNIKDSGFLNFSQGKDTFETEKMDNIQFAEFVKTHVVKKGKKVASISQKKMEDHVNVMQEKSFAHSQKADKANARSTKELQDMQSIFNVLMSIQRKHSSAIRQAASSAVVA